MPRSYEKKGSRAGRPPMNDSIIAEAALFANHVMGHQPEAARAAAIEWLWAARRLSAAGDATRKRKDAMSRDAARRRVEETVRAEFLTQDAGALTGLPPPLRALGAELASVAREQGYGFARLQLLTFIVSAMSGGGAEIRRDPTLLSVYVDAADAWIAKIERERAAG